MSNSCVHCAEVPSSRPQMRSKDKSGTIEFWQPQMALTRTNPESQRTIASSRDSQSIPWLLRAERWPQSSLKIIGLNQGFCTLWESLRAYCCTLASKPWTVAGAMAITFCVR